MHQHVLRALRVPLALLVASAALSIALGTGDEESARPGVGAYLIEFTAAEDCSVTLDGKPLATLKQGERRIVDLETAHGQVLVAAAAADGKTWERRLEAGSLQRPALNAITIDFQRASAPSKAEGPPGDSNKPRKSEAKEVIPPRLIEATKVRPVYPEAARQARVEGKVLLKAVVETDGRTDQRSRARSRDSRGVRLRGQGAGGGRPLAL
ncbi:MAG: hypothetical protein HC882_00120 [Acidobacteria bacterium]|nr:hypothetical protein [Acidobacteriota bacterium]